MLLVLFPFLSEVYKVRNEGSKVDILLYLVLLPFSSGAFKGRNEISKVDLSGMLLVLFPFSSECTKEKNKRLQQSVDRTHGTQFCAEQSG